MPLLVKSHIPEFHEGVCRGLPQRNEHPLCLHDPVLALRFCEQLVLLKDGCCVRVLHPAEDSLEEMEMALQEIYGDISLIECTGKNGMRHLTVLWEGSI